jgi:hypothetical protein
MCFANPTSKAIKYVIDSCARIGSFYGTTDVYNFLKIVAKDISDAKDSAIFQGRYKEHVAYAVNMIASNGFTSPPAAIASEYLNTRFEFYFRILSGKLNGDGTWIDETLKDIAFSSLGDSRIKNKRINDVALTYKIMKLNRLLPLVKHCEEIDRILYPSPVRMPDKRTFLGDIGDRIKYLRVRSAHGYWGDISSEAVFYGLMTAIVFYNQT